MTTKEKDAEISRLHHKLAQAEAEVAMCLEFLSTEMGWEYFRADCLYHDDAPKKRQSAENARLLRNFLARERRGITFLEEVAGLRADVAALRRLRAGRYMPWESAGGPNECAHGVAAGIACLRCDEARAGAVE